MSADRWRVQVVRSERLRPGEQHRQCKSNARKAAISVAVGLLCPRSTLLIIARETPARSGQIGQRPTAPFALWPECGLLCEHRTLRVSHSFFILRLNL